MTTMAKLLLCVMLSLWCVACQKTVDATEALVIVGSDLSVGEQLTRIDVEVYASNGTGLPLRSATFPLRSATSSEGFSLPVSFSIAPSSTSDTRSFRVVVTGIGALSADAPIAPVVEKQFVAAFRPNLRQRLEVFLSKVCLGKLCRDAEGRRADLTCNAAGECDTVPTMQLNPDPVEDASTEDGQVAPSDASTPDAAPGSDGAVAPGMDAASDGATGPDASDSAVVADAAPVVDAPPACDAASCVSPCTGSAGGAVCVQSTLHVCAADGTTQTTAACASAQQCELGLTKKMCPTCAPGTYRCVGVGLDVCAPDGFSWQRVKDCATEALCNATAGDCTTAACTATTRVCEGDNLRGCNAMQTGLVTLEQCNAGLCDQAGKQCDVCVANAKSCSADVRVVCDATGQTSTRTACGAPTPRCVGAAQCVQCTSPGDCTAPSGECQVATCSASGTCGISNKAAKTPCSGGVCNGSGSCVQCVDNTSCTSASKPLCSSLNRCVQCINDNHCSSARHEACEGGVCVVQPYCGDGQVTSGEDCDPKAAGASAWTCTSNCKKSSAYVRCDGNPSACINGTTCVNGLIFCTGACTTASDCPKVITGSTQAVCPAELDPTGFGICVAAYCNSAADCPPNVGCYTGSTYNYCGCKPGADFCK